MTGLSAEAGKWWATMKVSWSNQMAYKLNFVLMVLGPAIVFFFVKYNLWTSIYAMNPDSAIGGYTQADMIRYQAWVLIIGLLGQGHNAMQLAIDIRLGRISSYLIYPFNFWPFHAASFLAFQCVQLVVAAVTVGALRASGIVPLLNPIDVAAGVFFTLAVGFFWFSLQFLIGVAAFWLEETWILRVLVMTISYFLSGAIVPLEIYPEWLSRALFATPFPYITFVPARILMGEYSGSIATALAVLAFWTLVVWAFGQWVWRRGLRLYTAAGM